LRISPSTTVTDASTDPDATPRARRARQARARSAAPAGWTGCGRLHASAAGWWGLS